MAMPKIDETELHRILCSFQQFSPLYGDRLANHLPMATIALWRLGADVAQIRTFVQNYAERLQRRYVPNEVTATPVVATLGTHDFETNVRFFSTALKSASPEVVLERWVSRLLPGLATSAFHGLIRTAYAFESGCVSELAEALAFWASEYVDFPMRPVVEDRRPDHVIEVVVGHFGDGKSYSGIIIDRIAAAARDPFFARCLPIPRGLCLDQIRHEVVRLYSAQDDFTLLHTVTATHAMRMLMRFCDDQHAACLYLWQGVLLAVATISEVLIDRCETSDLPDASWDHILAISRESLDDHVVKLVYTAQQESSMGDAGLYRRLAARKVRITT